MAVKATDAAHAYHDEEFWAPPGLGCSHCHVNPPIVRTAFGALCEVCLCGWFPGRDVEWVLSWLVRQRVVEVRTAKRVAAYRAYRERGNVGLAVDYKREYGVWLLEIPEP